MKYFIHLAVSLVLVACSVACTPPQIDADDYDRSCTTKGDCTVVFVGSVCECPGDLAAISRSDEERYENDRRDKKRRCLGSTPSCEVSYGESALRCVDGKCRFGESSAGGSDVGTDTATDADN